MSVEVTTRRSTTKKRLEYQYAICFLSKTIELFVFYTALQPVITFDKYIFPRNTAGIIVLRLKSQAVQSIIANPNQWRTQDIFLGESRVERIKVFSIQIQ